MLINKEYSLTSDVAMYYYNIGVENYTYDVREEMMSILTGNEQSMRLMPEDIQECWEVYLYLQNKKGYDIGVYIDKLPINYLGNNSFVREWNTAMANFNISILYKQWLSLNETKGKLEKNIEKYHTLYESYKRISGNSLYICLPTEECIKNIEEVSIDTSKYIGSRVYTKRFTDYYSDVVYYEVGDVLNHLIKYRTVRFKSVKMGIKYMASSSKYKTKLRVFIKGLLMYVDLTNGYDWGRDWEYK